MSEQQQRFELLIDRVPYMIKAVPFEFNEETRFRVIVNDSPEYIFTWDSDLKRLAAIGDDASTMPDNLEIAIAEKLQSLKS